jgi:RNA polymerase sigma factor (sigma-70 family)
VRRRVQSSIETDVVRGYIHTTSYLDKLSPQLDGMMMEEVDDEEPVVDDGFISQRRPRSTLKRRSKLVPRSSRGASILSTRKKRSSRPSNAAMSTPSPSSNLLTFEEEKDIAYDIQTFRAVMRVRDNLVEWMTKDAVHNHQLKNQHNHFEPPMDQWAAACSLSVYELSDVVTRGQEARTKLIEGNVGLVTMIARRYHKGIGGPDAMLKLDDLIQEGHMGIMEAAERFDPTKGFRFSTYATHWIRQRMLRSIAETSRTIRLPVHVQTMIRNMNKKQKEMGDEIGRQPSMPELAHELGMSLDKIHLYQHLSKTVLSLELPVDSHSNTEDKRTLGDRIACTTEPTPDEDAMSEDLRGEVHAMLDALGHDERLVLTHRFGLEDGWPKTIRDTAENMGVSIDIVRVVESKALKKLRQPGMNYRLKDYVNGMEGGVGAEAMDNHHNNMQNNNMMMQSPDIAMNDESSHMVVNNHNQQHYYNYPHHMNTNNANAGGEYNSDEEYDRPTPESLWSF